MAYGYSMGYSKPKKKKKKKRSTKDIISHGESIVKKHLTLTAKQRNALPDSAFVYPDKRKYPVPTEAQAQAAGISEEQRQRILRNALSRAAQSETMGSYATVAKKVKTRGKSAGIQPSRSR